MEYSKQNSHTSIGQPVLSGGQKDLDIEGYREFIFLGDATDSIEIQSRKAYESLFQSLAAEESIVRIWNYIPNINAMVDENIDHYMLFNAGRYDAWMQYGPQEGGKPHCPAATATGATSGPVLVRAIISNHPVMYLGNPRQVRFVDYGEEYGKKPPCSSRLTVEDCGNHWRLWVAGTSAVVGQETQGANLFDQCQVTWENLDALLVNNPQLKDIGVKSFDIACPEYLCCYLKDPNSLSEYKTLIGEYFERKEPSIHLADICRGVYTGILYHEVECMYQIEK